MRTHGHREGSTTHWGLLGGIGEGQWGGSWGRIAWGEMPDIGEGRKAANHTATCIPMQQSCMFVTCTPKPKMQLKKKRIPVLQQFILDKGI